MASQNRFVRCTSFFGVIGLAAACASAPQQTSSAPRSAPKNDHRVTQAIERRDALERQFAAAPEDHRRRCEFQVGDCRLEVSDRRAALLESHESDRCQSVGDPDERFTCLMHDLAASGQAPAALGYYDFEARCLEQLIACTGKVEGQTIAERKRQLARARKERIEASREGVEARTVAAFAAEKASYLRAALPPDDDGACENQARFERCEAEARAIVEQFESELSKGDGQYNDARALKLYQSANKQLAACYKPENDCLYRRLYTYGGNQDVSKVLKETLAALELRERLVVQTGASAAEPCLMAGIKQHQDRIVENYQRFAREPVTYFQSRLHRAFGALHSSQVACLQKIQRDKPIPLAKMPPVVMPDASGSPVQVADTSKKP